MGRTQNLIFSEAEISRAGSIQHVIHKYLEDLQVRNYSANTHQVRLYRLHQWTCWCDDRSIYNIDVITRPLLERYQRHLFYYRKKNGKPLGVSTQAQLLKSVRLLFSWAVRKGYVHANPASDIDLPRPIHRIPEVLTVEEVGRVLNQPDLTSAAGVRDRCMMEVLYATGMRRKEALGLTLHDIDWETGVARIRQGKGNRDRLVPLGARALQWIERYRDDARLRLHPPADETHLFLSAHTGRVYGAEQLTSLMRRYLTAANIQKPGSCHIFRHTMATAMLDAGCDLRLIQELLGHKDIDSTVRYTHVSIEHLRSAHRTFHPTARHAETTTNPNDSEAITSS